MEMKHLIYRMSVLWFPPLAVAVVPWKMEEMH
jgi:hypothetical protein